jgi:hypothetical protein
MPANDSAQRVADERSPVQIRRPMVTASRCDGISARVRITVVIRAPRELRSLTQRPSPRRHCRRRRMIALCPGAFHCGL